MLAFYMSFIDDENDKSRFEVIYDTYRKRMVLTAYSVIHDRNEAEDVVHDTFIKIARNMKSINDPLSNETLSYESRQRKTMLSIFGKK